MMGLWISRGDLGKKRGWLGSNTPMKLDKVQNPYQMPDRLWVDTDIFMYKGQHIKEGDEIDVYLWELLIGFNARAFILLMLHVICWGFQKKIMHGLSQVLEVKSEWIIEFE